jgi:hypothetical protein
VALHRRRMRFQDSPAIKLRIAFPHPVSCQPFLFAILPFLPNVNSAPERRTRNAPNVLLQLSIQAASLDIESGSTATNPHRANLNPASQTGDTQTTLPNHTITRPPIPLAFHQRKSQSLTMLYPFLLLPHRHLDECAETMSSCRRLSYIAQRTFA